MLLPLSNAILPRAVTSPQGAKEDAAAVGKGADIVVHKAREAAEHLPAQLQELHLPASLHLPESAATLQARAGMAREKAEKGLASLGALGSKLVLGTHDLFEQIRWAHYRRLFACGPCKC